MSKASENYGYSQVRTTLPNLVGVDKSGKGHTFHNVPVILNRVNGAERSVTVLDRTNGKAIARLVSASF